MNTVFIIIGILMVVAGIVLTAYNSYRRNNDYDVPNSKKVLTVILCVVGIVLFVIGFCFKIVPTGYTGVRVTFGQVSPETVPQGFNLQVPFVQSVKLVNNKQQDASLEAEVWGETAEKTPVFASDIDITFQINSSKSAWIYANVSNSTNELLTGSIVSSAIKSAMVELSVNDVTNRSKIEPLVKEKLAASLNEKYGEDTVVVLKVVINNMDFEDSYNEAIAAKSIAQQTYEKQKIENETAIAKAEANKKVAITDAEAAAQATLIAAEAEADANELLAASLTDEVLLSKYYEKWNGELPTVMGENTVITDIGTANKEGASK